MAALYDAMASALGVAEEDRYQLLASGRQSRFKNRVGWAKTYLTKAGLLESASPRCRPHHPKWNGCFVGETGEN